MFQENLAADWNTEREKLLQRKIDELGLKLEGTRLEKIVERLYEDLERARIRFKPRVYLSDEWGCPEGVPIIGIPFYLADEKLSRIEDEIMEGIEAESDDEILRYLRHEAGHAFNYAYKLYESEEWRRVFGPYSRPYYEQYKPNPFSMNFVRHIPGWYAQKHPDEDFAETFAVWLDPESNWRERYKDWGCYGKLLYVDKVAKEWGPMDPLVSVDAYDVSLDLRGSILEHYNKFQSKESEVPAYFDSDLRDIFEKKTAPGRKDERPSAEMFLIKHRRGLVRNINYWTGLHESLIKTLISHFAVRCKILDLRVNPDKVEQTLVEITAYATTLCMNKLYKGDFILK